MLAPEEEEHIHHPQGNTWRQTKKTVKKEKKKLPKKKKKKKKKKDKRILESHHQFELTYDMMLGIRTTVSLIESKPPRELTTLDFTDCTRLRFPQQGTSITPPHKMRKFKFKDYCPEGFRHIRERFGISPQDYLLQLCGDFKFLEFISNSKSGQFFFYTHDRQYMIKTVSTEECKFFRKILPHYYHHIMENPNTLLSRFYGMHRVKPHRQKEYHFLIFGSVFHRSLYVSLTFDLKGSTHGRAATAEEKKDDSCVYKDLDFLEQKVKLDISPNKKELLQQQLQADVNFLASLNLMDYSLLLGIHDPAVRRHDAEVEESHLDEPDAKESNDVPDAERLHAASTDTDEKVATDEEKSPKANSDGNSEEPAITHSDVQLHLNRANVASQSLSDLSEAKTAPNRSAGSSLAVPEGRLRRHSDVSASRRTTTASRPSRARETKDDFDVHVQKRANPFHHIFSSPNLGARAQQRRQSRYGLPKHYNKFTTPEELAFDVPDFEQLHLPERKVSVRPEDNSGSLFTRDDGGIRGFTDGRPDGRVYYMGIIDILTLYNAKKKAEHFFKSLRHDKNAISAVPARQYGDRFINFINAALED